MFDDVDPYDGGPCEVDPSDVDPCDEEPLLSAGFAAEWAAAAAAAGAALEAVEAAHQADPLGGGVGHADGAVDIDANADAVLRAAAAQQRMLNLIGWQQLETAAQWADLHGELHCLGTAATVGTPSAAPRRGAEILVQPGGEGTPYVAEFAPAELAAILGVSSMSAGNLMADALDLRHRLPRLWDRLQTGDVKVFVARKVATRTRRLTQHSASRVDAKVAPLAASVPFGRLEKILEAAILAADPVLAAADARAAAEKRGVWRGRELVDGTATVFGRGDALDIAAFDATVTTVARALGLLGDDATMDVRRSRALGVLANPHAAIELVDAAEAARQGRRAAGTATRADHRRCILGPATLYVHVSREALADAAAGNTAAGVARVEDIGAVLLSQVRGWLTDRIVRVQPVIDLADLPAVDSYEIPDRMGEAVRLRTPADCFPYGVNLSRRGDLDHTDPYIAIDDGGPPGQTAVDNLGRMTRRHHRIKTHSGWKVTQPRSGVWIWRSPHGHHYLVDHHGTTALGKLT